MPSFPQCISRLRDGKASGAEWALRIAGAGSGVQSAFNPCVSFQTSHKKKLTGKAGLCRMVMQMLCNKYKLLTQHLVYLLLIISKN